jgi:hypothetical protein
LRFLDWNQALQNLPLEVWVFQASRGPQVYLATQRILQLVKQAEEPPGRPTIGIPEFDQQIHIARCRRGTPAYGAERSETNDVILSARRQGYFFDFFECLHRRRY